ncbi:MAG: preprotein translocase subunit YajC [Candidatus Hydrogenedentota bacterium]
MWWSEHAKAAAVAFKAAARSGAVVVALMMGKVMFWAGQVYAQAPNAPGDPADGGGGNGAPAGGNGGETPPFGGCGEEGGGGGSSLIFLLLIFVVMMFLLSWPRQREEKKRKQMISALQKGDEVVTIGGMVGTIQSLGEEHAIIKLDDDVTVKFLRSAVSRVVSPEEKSADKK